MTKRAYATAILLVLTVGCGVARREGDADVDSDTDADSDTDVTSETVTETATQTGTGTSTNCGVALGGACGAATCDSDQVCVADLGPVGPVAYYCDAVPTCPGGCPTCDCINEPACDSGACVEQPERLDCGCGAIGTCASRRRLKEDIEYLSDGDLERLYRELRRVRLARWRYKTEAPGGKRHLGFIIDDDEASPAVAAGGETVDLYAYTSLAVAAIQEQARRIDALERELRGK